MLTDERRTEIEEARRDALLQYGSKDGAYTDLNDLLEEVDRLRKALEQIRDECGHVCDDFMSCRHRACSSSYRAWAVADEALGKTEALSTVDSKGAEPGF